VCVHDVCSHHVWWPEGRGLNRLSTPGFTAHTVGLLKLSSLPPAPPSAELTPSVHGSSHLLHQHTYTAAPAHTLVLLSLCNLCVHVVLLLLLLFSVA